MLEEQRQMDKTITQMLDTNMEFDLIRILFLEQYPGQEEHFDEFCKEYLDE